MKKLLTVLSILALGTTTGNLGNSLNTSIITNNNINENNNEMTERIDYKWSDSYGPYFSINGDNSDIYTLLNWKQYSSSWEEFINKYQSFAFDKSSFFKVETGNNACSVDFLKPLSTSLIKTKNTSNWILNIIYSVKASSMVSSIDASLMIWHDDNNIYFQWDENDVIFSSWPLAIPTSFDVYLNIVKFWTSFSNN